MSFATGCPASTLRLSEFVLGLLGGEERAALERVIAADRAAATQIALWEDALMPLAEGVPEIDPSLAVWQQISQATAPANPLERYRETRPRTRTAVRSALCLP